jgi:hypothetical protein
VFPGLNSNLSCNAPDSLLCCYPLPNNSNVDYRCHCQGGMWRCGDGPKCR